MEQSTPGQRRGSSGVRTFGGGRMVLRSLAAALVFAPSLCAQADRITMAVDGGQPAILDGHISPRIRAGTDQGTVPDALRLEHVSLVLKRSDAQQANLDELLAQQRDSGSAQYRNWLTPEEFADRFGLSGNDMDKVVQWLKSTGFTNVEAARGRGWVTFSGAAGQFRKAFGISIDYIDLAGKRHYANVNEPNLPPALQQVSLGFQGLTSFQPKPALQWSDTLARRTAGPRTSAAANCPQSTPQELVPADFATIYDVNPLYNAGIDGNLQKIAVVGEAAVTGTTLLADLAQFRSLYKLPSTVPTGAGTSGNPVTTVLAGAAPSGNDTAPLAEADLDLEWAGAVAPDAQIIYAYAQNPFDAAAYVIDNKTAPVLSMSFGTCEPDAADIDPLIYRAFAQQASAEGITWLAASGDGGAAGCDVFGIVPEATNGYAVSLPASIPEVTAVGGTEFAEGSTGACFWNGSGLAMSYIPEIAWNDTSLAGTLLASGGGASKFFSTKPLWQLNLGDSARDVPDLAFTASPVHDPYQIVYNGSNQTIGVGGTSASTPSFAGILALLNQYVSAKSTASAPGLGDINPGLYALAQAQPTIFHDITVGNNLVPCGSGTTGCPTAAGAAKVIGFSALPGYDEVTGLGSVDAYAFVKAWASGAPTTTTVSVIPASFTVSDEAQFSATVIPGSGTALPTGTVNFFILQTPSPLFLGSVQLSGATGTASANITVQPGIIPPGADVIGAVYSGDKSFGQSNGTTEAIVSSGSGHSSVLVTIPSPVPELPAGGEKYNWSVPITLQNLTAVATTLIRFTVTATPAGSTTANINTDLSGSIANMFGGSAIPASGSVTATFGTDAITAPESAVFTFTGVDAGGYAWSRTRTVTFNGTPGEIANVVNGASFAPPGIPSTDPGAKPGTLVPADIFAPGMILSVFGPGLSEFSAVSPLPLPTALLSDDGVWSVQSTINGTAAPLFYVSPSQINLQVPYELQSSFSATISSIPAVLLLNNGGVVSSFSFIVQPAAPGIFANNNGVWNTPSGGLASVNSQSNPATPGSVVTVYFTGAGALKGATGIPDGQSADASTPLPLATPTLTVNGLPVTGVTVSMLPGAVGIAQAVFTVPAGLPVTLESYSLAITLQGVASTAGTAIAPPPVTSNTVSLWVGSSN